MVDVLLIFPSAGIKDTANDFVLTIADDGITVDVIKTKVIANNVTVQGDLTVTGGITATQLHVDEITADIRNERTSHLRIPRRAWQRFDMDRSWTYKTVYIPIQSR